MAKKEFDNLTGRLKPDAYKHPVTPKPKLSRSAIMVLMLEKTKVAKLHLNNWWIIIKAFFNQEALALLTGEPSLVMKIIAARYVLLLIGGIVLVLLLVSLFK